MKENTITPKQGNVFQIDIDVIKLWVEKSVEEKKAIAFCKDIGTLPTQIYTSKIIQFDGKLHIKNAFHIGICMDTERPIRILFKKDIEPIIIDTLPEESIKECNIPSWAELDEIGADLTLSEELNAYPIGKHPQEKLYKII